MGCNSVCRLTEFPRRSAWMTCRSLQSTETGDGVATDVSAGQRPRRRDAGRRPPNWNRALIFALTYPLSEVRAGLASTAPRVDTARRRAGCGRMAEGRTRWLALQRWRRQIHRVAVALLEGTMRQIRSGFTHSTRPRGWRSSNWKVGGRLTDRLALGRRYGEVADGARSLGWTPVADRFSARPWRRTRGLRTGAVAVRRPRRLPPCMPGLPRSIAAYRVARADGARPGLRQLMVAGCPGHAGHHGRRPAAPVERWQEGAPPDAADMQRRGDILVGAHRAAASACPPAVLCPGVRDALVVQQAVQLVEQGDRTTALSPPARSSARRICNRRSNTARSSRWTVRRPLPIVASPSTPWRWPRRSGNGSRSCPRRPGERVAGDSQTRCGTGTVHPIRDRSRRHGILAVAHAAGRRQRRRVRPVDPTRFPTGRCCAPRLHNSARRLPPPPRTWQEMQVSAYRPCAAGDPWQSIAADPNGRLPASRQAQRRPRAAARQPWRHRSVLACRPPLSLMRRREWRDLARDSQVVIGLFDAGRADRRSVPGW